MADEATPVDGQEEQIAPSGSADPTSPAAENLERRASSSRIIPTVAVPELAGEIKMVNVGEDPITAEVMKAETTDELKAALKKIDDWKLVCSPPLSAKSQHQYHFHRLPFSRVGWIRALSPSALWQHTDLKTAIERSKVHVTDKDVIAAFHVSSINEWGIAQQRVLVLSKTTLYRVNFDAKAGKARH